MFGDHPEERVAALKRVTARTVFMTVDFLKAMSKRSNVSFGIDRRLRRCLRDSRKARLRTPHRQAGG